jgi:hypothetical protein
LQNGIKLSKAIVSFFILQKCGVIDCCIFIFGKKKYRIGKKLKSYYVYKDLFNVIVFPENEGE